MYSTAVVALTPTTYTHTVRNTVQPGEPISPGRVESHSGKCRNSKSTVDVVEPDGGWIRQNSKSCIEDHILMSDGKSTCMWIFFLLENEFSEEITGLIP